MGVSVPLPLDQLRAELDRRAATVYLLTVGDSGRPHCVGVRVGWCGAELEVRTGTTSARNAGTRPGVAILAPPRPALPDEVTGQGGGADTSGYSLIVDGDVTGTSTSPEGGGVVRIRPLHAVFHRPAVAGDGTPAHDCIPMLDSTAS